MLRWLLGTDLLVKYFQEGDRLPLFCGRHAHEIAVSAVSIEWLLQTTERSSQFSPIERERWRENILFFREYLFSYGGAVLDVSKEAWEVWRTLGLISMKWHPVEGTDDIEMPVEERIVLATAVASQLTFLTTSQDWISTSGSSVPVRIEII